MVLLGTHLSFENAQQGENTMSNSKSRTTQISRDEALIAGVEKHLSGVTLTLSGQALTTKQIVSELQDLIDAANAVEPARAAWQAAVAAEKAQQASSQEFLVALRQAVLAMFRSQPDVLADFSLTAPKKRPKLTSAQAALKAARSKATRVARGTLGPVARQQIKGNVSSIQIVPQTAPVVTTNGSSVTPLIKA
jgi:hypothetical protein